ncbi:hypothetical protein [Bacillus cereus]|nr:hypothetical protein [Bacillus cereus]
MVHILFGVLIGVGVNDLIEKNVKHDIDKLLENKRERLRLLKEKNKF